MTKNSFVIMAKPVGSRCNMHCSYCYYLEKGRYSTHEKQSRMSYHLLEKLIRQTIEGNPGPVVSFTWHGGEPTLAGIEFYKKVVKLEKQYLPKGWQAWNSLQTNALLLNDAWAKFIKENHFDVGLSIDGTALTHNTNRHAADGTDTFERVYASALRLKKQGIEPDLLCTVNSVTVRYPVEVYKSLRELGTGWIQFIPVVVRRPDGGLAGESVTPEGYGEFLCTIFDEWVHHDLGKLDVQLFAELARVMAGGTSSLCWMSETCGRVLIAEEDGSIYACDHFVDAQHRIGSLYTGKLEALANSPGQLAFGNSKKTTLTRECIRCPYIPYCRGGCLKDRFALSADGESGHSYLCPGLKAFFSHAVPVLKEVMKLSSLGKSPDEIMKLLNARVI